MPRRNRREFNANEIEDIHARWRQGQTQCEIGRAFDRASAVIGRVILRSGGFPLPVRSRSSRALSLQEREEISRGLSAGQSATRIAARLGRSPSTVCREIARNGGRVHYRATSADERAWKEAQRPKPCKLATERRLRAAVSEKLLLDWSPEQISGWLRRSFPENASMQVSHETIYRSLFVQARGVLKKELTAHLRSKRRMRHARTASVHGHRQGQIVDAVTIRERPAQAEDRAVPGHWEGDLVAGCLGSYVATLVERRSRLTMLVKVEGKSTDMVVPALARQIRKLPQQLRRSLTWDRGLEMAKHKELTVATDVEVYFCDPSSPWQRGTNENTNRLLRQYLPKGSDLSQHSQADLNRIARRLNQRPRKTLDFRTPADTFHDALR
ncbi:MAG: IS30 family transposase [Planctomycetota bacterium]|jgi:IS30 family transposase